MKIAAIIDNKLGAGGGFDQALNAIIRMKHLCASRYQFKVYSLHKENLDILFSLDIEAEKIEKTWLDRVFIGLGCSALWCRFQAHFKLTAPLENKLIKEKVDLVYFVTPSSIPIGFQRLNYIITLWDLCHRDYPEFPEVNNYGEFYRRESVYKNLLSRAYTIVTDSDELADKAAIRYGVDRDRFLPIHFSPSPLLKEIDDARVDEVKTIYGLPQSYFYYPAQYWPHKNHIRILQALKELRDRHGVILHVVFSGKDYGNLDYVRRYIKLLDLDAQVIMLGFVPSEHVGGLYKGALAIIMPTYFGPTNLPPLEAWALGVPLVYSSHLVGQVDDAAELVDVDDPDSLAKAMLSVLDQKRRDELIAAGKSRLEKVREGRRLQEVEFKKRLDRFFMRRMLWG